MEPGRWERMWDLFHEAMERPAPEREAFLAGLEAEDQELAGEVLELVRAREAVPSFFATVGRERGLAAALRLAMPPEGDRIGPYVLGPILGRGGMGIVYEARQEEPVERLVALKLIPWGMDSGEVVRRFEAERRTLARMSHPHIAQVLDAGTTSEGRPFFVMERVDGLPITELCDRQRLSTESRLELFRDVCRAVQHAHRRGVLHRDLKPSNLLVTMHEGRPVPKVIDFGIARALERDASQLLTATGDGRVVGTPEYMSPEQAAADPDLDTRTDVYSLGAILYEMLTGSVPFPFGDSSPAAVEKVLRHDDPPRPSTRVATLGPATAIVAQARGTSPGRLARRLAGELDWIVMKALEKDRDRRYSSVADLAADVERHLEHRPVIAGPPSLGYRVRKFVRRHRVPVAAAAAVVAALVLGLFGTGWMAVVAARERGAAEIARDQARRDADAAEAARGFLESMLAAANPTTGAATGEVSRDVRVADVLDRAAATLGETFAGQPEVEASLRETLGRTYLELGLFDEGEQQFERAAAIYRAARGDDDARTLKALHDLASIFERQGRFDEAGELFRTTLERQRRALGDRHPDTLASQGSLNDILFQQGKLEHPAEVYRELVERSHDILGDDHPNTLQSRNDLGVVLGSEGRYEESVAAYRISVEHHERALGADHPDSLRARSNLGGALISLGELAEAAALHETLVADMETIMGPDHPETLRTQSNLGAMHFKQGDLAAAAATWSEVLETYRRTLGPDHYLALVTLANVARVTQDIGRLAEAEGLYRELVAAAARSLPERHPNLGIYRGGLGVCLMRQERYAEAETELLAALEANRAVLGPEHPRTVVATERLTELYSAWGRPQSQTPESPGTS